MLTSSTDSGVLLYRVPASSWVLLGSTLSGTHTFTTNGLDALNFAGGLIPGTHRTGGSEERDLSYQVRAKWRQTAFSKDGAWVAEGLQEKKEPTGRKPVP